MAPILRPLVVIVLSPITAIITMLVRLILRLFGFQLTEEQSILSAHDEIRGAMEVLHKDGSMVKDDRDRLGGILDLHELELSDVMIHRTNMETINLDDRPEQIVKQILDSPYTRIPIVAGR